MSRSLSRARQPLSRISLRTFEGYHFWLAGFAVSDTPECYNDNTFSAMDMTSVLKESETDPLCLRV